MNKVDKGRRVERTAILALEADGYLVHRCVRHVVAGRWGPTTLSNDIFGVVDLIAKKAGERTRWIQVTSSSHITRKTADLESVPWDDEHDSVELWRWVDGTGPRRDARTGRERQRRYFQIYRRETAYRLRRGDRIDAA